MKFTGRSLHCQVEHYVRTKFATPILHAIDSFRIYDIFFYIYITIDGIFLFFFEIFSHIHFCSNVTSLEKTFGQTKKDI